MSGESVGSVGTKWYNLSLLGGISVMPARGSERAVYEGLQEEGRQFEILLHPLQDEIEKIVLEAREKFDAPIVIYDPDKFTGYIGSTIDEDVMEFNPKFISSTKTEQERKEIIEYEERLYKSKIDHRDEMTRHFEEYFKKGSHIPIDFTQNLPDRIEYYKFSITVDARTKRSTLNWIRDQVTPKVLTVLAEVKKGSL